jgi:branched-chain amino acid transport system ATP-binding protein
MLEVSDLVVSYGKLSVIKQINLHVGKGAFVALVGANGSGKSTILRSISGLIPVESGAILFEGNLIVGLKPWEIVKMGLMQCPEGRFIINTISVRENLLLGAYSRKGNVRGDLSFIYELFPILAIRQKQQGGTLSGGEQQMLAIGRALMGRPRFLMLDEVSLGLGPRVIEEIREKLVELRKLGLSILLSEQNAVLAFSLADRGYVLDFGMIKKEGRIEELKNDESIREAYIGV